MSDTNGNPVSDPRQARGERIAKRGQIKESRGHWLVPSESMNIKYTVDLANGGWCSCPDHDERGVKCKHIWAVELTIQRETNEKGEVTETRTLRATYSQQWSAYNAAQTSEQDRFMELLHGLCAGIEEPRQVLGRPRLPLSDMAFSGIFKVFSTVSARRFMCDLATAQDRGYIARVPHFNLVLRYLADEAMTPVLKQLVTESSLPLRSVETNFAVDSSGFSTSNHITWYDHKYGDAHTKSHWLKAHLMCGVQTNVVTSVEISGALSNDSPYFTPLVSDTARYFNMQEVSADKAYLSRANLALVDSLGAVPFIPFKRNQDGRESTSRLWEKMWRYFQFQQEDFMGHYHRRSNVETTFSMIKRKFGSHLRAKSDVGQVNELLAKIVAHNICCLNHAIHELNLEPVFWQENQQAFA